MFQKQELPNWYFENNMPELSRAVIDIIRSSQPSQSGGRGKSSVSGRYPSRKMGVTIQFESHRLGLAAIYTMENDPDVLEIYDHLPAFKHNYVSAKGQRIGIRRTATFFVIRKFRAGWEEWTTQDELEAIAAKDPNRFSIDDDGAWSCPSGIAHAKHLGLYYEVHSSSELNPTYLRNIILLEDYTSEKTPGISTENEVLLKKVTTGVPGISLSELYQITDATMPRDTVLAMIATDGIHVDLNDAPLVEPARVKVYPDRDFSVSIRAENSAPASKILDVRNGSIVMWDTRTWAVANLGQSSVALIGSDQAVTELSIVSFESLIRSGRITLTGRKDDLDPAHNCPSPLMSASKHDLDVALNRQAAVNTWLQNPAALPAGCPSERTIQRWVAAERQACAGHNRGLVGLLPRTSAQGNRSDRLDRTEGKRTDKPLDTARKVMDNHILGDYESKSSPNKHSSWLKLKPKCEALGFNTPSYRTFCAACNKRSKYEQTKKRKGIRAADKFAQVCMFLERGTPRHGDRPFEVIHIDHTELDIELVSEETGKNLKRPWLTIMTDAFSRRVLAMWLSFDPPSYRSCMMVIRDCVKRHNRLPQIIIVDNGAEFRSTYFEALLAAYRCTKKNRPPGKPRFGSVIERLFGTINTQFIHNLRGNTKITREVRIMTKSVNPKRLAIWTLRELNECFNEYLFESYDQQVHPALGQSPREAFMQGMEANGLRLHMLIRYDRDFVFSTLPTTFKGTAKLITGQGIKIHYIRYWSDFFKDPELEGSQIPVRYDPFNAGIAYAYVRNQWVECTSEYYSVFNGRSEREINLATQELRGKNQSHVGARSGINAKILASFLQSVEVGESTLSQQAHDRELIASASGLPVLSGSQVSPSACVDDAADDDVPFVQPDISSDAVETYGGF